MNRSSFVSTLVLLSACCLFLSTFITNNVDAQQKIAANSYNPSPLENEVLAEINLARTRPQEYVAYLEQLRPYFKGKTLQLPGQPASDTQEGIVALDEAINALRAMKPQSPYNFSSGMSLGANLLVKEQGLKGLTGHKGVDGGFCDQRLARFGRIEGPVGEALSYSAQTARQRVLTWLVDDGFSTRGHRNSLLNSGYKVAGVSCGDHARFSMMCVVDFASGFSDTQAGNVARSF
ncbi:MAG: hypothetical protein QOE33_1831 [Acidobacteriota bacterium]|nr:hypothetical protein [Acidobacteriota bacterium]